MNSAMMGDENNDAASFVPKNQMVLRTKDCMTKVYDVVTSLVETDDDGDIILQHKASLVVAPDIPQVRNSAFHACSPNGTHLFVQQYGKGMIKIDLEQPSSSEVDADQPPFLKDSAAVQFAAFSPKGT
jgi:hypothetical protein